MSARHINLKNQCRRMNIELLFFAQLTSISPNYLGQFKINSYTMADLVTTLKKKMRLFNHSRIPSLSLYNKCKKYLRQLRIGIFAYLEQEIKALDLPDVSINEIHFYLTELIHDFQNTKNHSNHVFIDMLHHFYHDYLAALIALGSAPPANELPPLKLEEKAYTAKKMDALGYATLTTTPRLAKLTTIAAKHPRFQSKDKTPREGYIPPQDILLAHHASYKNKALQMKNAEEREQLAAEKFRTLQHNDLPSAIRLNTIMHHLRKRDYQLAIIEMVQLPEPIRQNMGTYLPESRYVSYLKHAMLDESFRNARKYGMTMFAAAQSTAQSNPLTCHLKHSKI